MIFGPVAFIGGAGPVTVTPVTTGAGTTHTGISIGEATKDRLLVVGVSFADLNNPPGNIAGVAVNGDTMDVLVQERIVIPSATALGYEAAIFSIDAGDGSALEGDTTANIAVTTTGSARRRNGVHIFTVSGGKRPFDTTTYQDSLAANVTSFSIDIVPETGDGLVACFATATASTTTATWTGATAHGDFQQDSPGSFFLRCLSAYDSKTVAGERALAVQTNAVMNPPTLAAVLFRRKS